MSDLQQFSVVHPAKGYWHVTFNNPPMNLFDPDTVYELLLLMDQMESDPELKVVVFDSADPDYFMAHYDMSRAAERPRHPGYSVVPALIDFTTRLEKLPAASIALIRGRARGVGSEFVLSCDMRFASLEKAVLGQPEVAAGVIPGGGGNERLPLLVGRSRALEIILGSDDFDAETAERYGWINRALPDAELDGFVRNLALRIASFDKEALTEAKALVNNTGLPQLSDLLASSKVFVARASSPSTLAKLPDLFARGLGRPSDFELNLGRNLGPS
ncbi:enoyl-CoA hydratase/isomerase family protein [Paenibacillaceae bacterium]|nr:enoyl-CoA hydratase/isomerase family protein [Paenibacillaceae bacterium]